MNQPVSAKTKSVRIHEIIDFILVLCSLALAILVSSFVARNSDLWQHLATGRLIAEGNYDFNSDPLSFRTEGLRWINHCWLTDLISFVIFQKVGGEAIVALKAFMVCMALVIASKTFNRKGWTLGKAFLILIAEVIWSPRAVLQPIIVSCLMLAITLRLMQIGGKYLRLIPIVTLFWVNLDEWFIFAPVLTLIGWIGSKYRRDNEYPTSVPLLTLAACFASPFHLHGLTIPMELSPSLWRSDFMKDPRVSGQFSSYFTNSLLSGEVSDSPAFWAFLAAAIVGSILVAIQYKRIKAWEIGVWTITLALSVWQSRLIPFFAVNFVAIFARLGWTLLPEVRLPRIARSMAFVATLAVFLLCWGGWLQGSRGRDRILGWKVYADPTLIQAAESINEWRTKGIMSKDTHIVCAQPDAANVLMWFAHGEKSYIDTRWDLHSKTSNLASNVLSDDYRLSSSFAKGLSEAEIEKYKIGAILISEPTSGIIEGIVAGDSPWQTLRIDGRSIWLTAPRLFRPMRTTGQNKAVAWDPLSEVFGRGSESELLSSRFTKFQDWWLPVSSTRLVDTSSAGKAAILSNLFIASKSNNPELALLAIRSAREGTSKNPDDSQAWIELAKAYSLLGARVESRLANDSGLLKEMRRVQRVTALANAVLANPESEAAREALAGTLSEVGYLDRAIQQRKIQRQLILRRGDRERLAIFDESFQIAENELFDRECMFTVRTYKMSGDPLGRARIATGLGLANLAIEILIKSSPELYGIDGLKLLVGLLLGTGQVSEAKTLLDRDEIRQFPARLGVHDIASMTLEGERIVYRVPAFDWFQFLLAAGSCVSDPKKHLESIEKYLIGEVANARSILTKIAKPLATTIAIDVGLGFTGMTMPRFINSLRREELLGPVTQSRFIIAEHAELKFLEGCCALEVGQLQHAKKCFATAKSDYDRVEDLKVAPAKQLLLMYRNLLADNENKP